MPPSLSENVLAQLLVPRPLAPGIVDEYERPASELVRPYTELSAEPLASMVGIPFDTSILGRRGAKSGPEAVRWGINASLLYEPNLDIDLAEAPRVADYGDVDVYHTDVDRTWDRVSDVVAGLIGLGVPLLSIGGDHGLTYPILRGFCRATRGKVGVILVDAHLDYRISHHGEKSSGVPFRYMLRDLGGQVSGRNFTEIGIGGWLNTKRYHSELIEQGVRIITQRELRSGDFPALVREAIERAAEGTDAIYLTFDIDAIDGAVAGATNVPAVGGLTPLQGLDIVFEFAQHPKAMAMDIMEVSPSWDHSTLTERMAAALALNFFAGVYSRKLHG